REQVVDAADEVSCAHNRLGLERAQRPYVIGAGGEERHLVLRLPFLDVLSLALEAEQHERRRPFRVDKVAAGLGEKLYQGFVGRGRPLELFGKAFADVEEQGDYADALGQHADQLLEPAGSERRFDTADHAAPTRECHARLLSLWKLLRRAIDDLAYPFDHGRRGLVERL